MKDVNKSELIALARMEGLPNLSRAATIDEIVDVLMDDESSHGLCPLEKHRETMEEHIHKNFRRLRTQLPGCNGKCVSFGCPDLVVVRCWEAMKSDIL